MMEYQYRDVMGSDEDIRRMNRGVRAFTTDPNTGKFQTGAGYRPDFRLSGQQSATSIPRNPRIGVPMQAVNPANLPIPRPATQVPVANMNRGWTANMSGPMGPSGRAPQKMLPAPLKQLPAPMPKVGGGFKFGNPLGLAASIAVPPLVNYMMNQQSAVNSPATMGQPDDTVGGVGNFYSNNVAYNNQQERMKQEGNWARPENLSRFSDGSLPIPAKPSALGDPRDKQMEERGLVRNEDGSWSQSEAMRNSLDAIHKQRAEQEAIAAFSRNQASAFEDSRLRQMNIDKEIADLRRQMQDNANTQAYYASRGSDYFGEHGYGVDRARGAAIRGQNFADQLKLLEGQAQRTQGDVNTTTTSLTNAQKNVGETRLNQLKALGLEAALPYVGQKAATDIQESKAKVESYRTGPLAELMKAKLGQRQDTSTLKAIVDLINNIEDPDERKAKRDQVFSQYYPSNAALPPRK
jgi:hypothetical protein